MLFANNQWSFKGFISLNSHVGNYGKIYSFSTKVQATEF